MSQGARTELVEELRQLGIEMVTAEYNGEGDSGQIDTLEFGPVEVPNGISTAVENLFYEVLEDLYAGWENNEGAFGEFTWNVPADQIVLRHTTRSEFTEEQDL